MLESDDYSYANISVRGVGSIAGIIKPIADVVVDDDWKTMCLVPSRLKVDFRGVARFVDRQGNFTFRNQARAKLPMYAVGQVPTSDGGRQQTSMCAPLQYSDT